MMLKHNNRASGLRGLARISGRLVFLPAAALVLCQAILAAPVEAPWNEPLYTMPGAEPGWQPQAFRPGAPLGGAGLGFMVLEEAGPEAGAQLFIRNAKIDIFLLGRNIENYCAPRTIEGPTPYVTKMEYLGLGLITLPSEGKEEVTAGGGETDWTRRSIEISANDDAEAVVTATRLSPAVLIELGPAAYSLSLFAGNKRRHDARMKRGEPPVPLTDPCSPRHFAWSDGKNIRLASLETIEAGGSSVSLNGVENGWLLLWYGSDAWFMTGATSMEFMSAMSESALAAGDMPMLLLFSQPVDISLQGGTPHGGSPLDSVALEFFEGGAKLSLLPLYGYKLPPAAETRRWSEQGKLPDDVARRCDWWAARGRLYPVSVKESWNWDAATDMVELRQKFQYIALGEGKPSAPVPPMLEMARRYGLTVELSAPVSDSGMATYCGPFAVIEGAEGYTVRFKGMGKYAFERPAPRPLAQASGSGAAAVREELNAEVDRILAAGHMAPHNWPWKASWGWSIYTASSARLLFSAPGEMLGTLASALPWLDETRRNKMLEYIVKERRQYPPETVAHLPDNEGAWRGRGKPVESISDPKHKTDDTSTWRWRDSNFHVKNKLVPAEALYDLASYYAAVGPDKMKEDNFNLSAAMGKTVLPWLRRIEWATLGWYSWPMKERDNDQWATYGWNRAYDVNQQSAALIGLARLARMQGDSAAEALGMAFLARALTHRFALGKYTQWLYEVGGIMYEPEGFVRTDDWRVPSMNEEWAILDYGFDSWCSVLSEAMTMEAPYAAMVPETGRFIADHLRQEAADFARVQVSVNPTSCMMTLGESRRYAETHHNYPEDTRQFFLLNAWILGKDGDWLHRHLDMPLVPLGDWYYIDKLVATLQSYAGVEWKPFQ